MARRSRFASSRLDRKRVATVARGQSRAIQSETRGMKMIKRFTSHGDTERYEFDFGECSYANGWAQIDTRQDAPYYGLWCNPTKRAVFSYCEGDRTLEFCADDIEFAAHLRSVADWQKKAGYWIGIDAGIDGTMRARFTALGVADLLH